MNGWIFVLNIFFAVLSDASYAVLTGCLLGSTWIQTTASRTLNRLRVVRFSCIAGLVMADLVHPWFVAASMTGTNGFSENLVQIPGILSGTHQGTLWFVNSAAVAVLGLITLAEQRDQASFATGCSLAAVLVFAAGKAASGHASDAGDFTVAELSMLLHLVSIAVWSGAVITSGFIVVPQLAREHDQAALWTYATLLSRTVTWALGISAVSGIYNSDRELNGLSSQMWVTTWGRVLLLKLSFVGIALTLGAWTRFRYLRGLRRHSTPAKLVRLLTAEAVVMTIVICLSGGLANTPPPPN